MRLEVNIEKKFVFSLVFVLILFGGFVFVIAQGSVSVPNPGHVANDVRVRIGGVDWILQNAINQGEIQRGISESCEGDAISVVNDDGTVECAGSSGFGSCELLDTLETNQAAAVDVDVPLRCMSGNYCKLMLITEGSTYGADIGDFIRGVHSGTLENKWYIHNKQGLETGIDGSSAEEVILSTGGFFEFQLVDDKSGQTDPDKWSLRALGGAEGVARLYLC